MQKKILIVDDEAHIRTLIQQTLEELEEEEDVEIITAADGEEALQLIVEESPNLVFLDVMMPKMNGMDVCNKVKNVLKLEAVFIILLTAKGQELDKQQGVEVGANLYLTKPFDPDLLLNKAREVLDIRK